MARQEKRSRRSLIALVAVVVGLAAGVMASPAQANHIPGATYTGTTSTGGTVSFTVAANGSGINTVSITDPGPTCAFSSLTKYYSNSSAGPLPIVNHAFSDPDPGFRFQGSFPGGQRAQGSFGGSQCATSLSWSATTTSPPPAAPQTMITRHPDKLQRALTARVGARFAFRSSKPGSTFECRLDRRAWRACRSPKTYEVGGGKHAFRVRATDATGAVDPTPAIWRWRVVRGGAPSPPTGAWTACPGTFRVLHRDHIGPLRVPRGSYRITTLQPWPPRRIAPGTDSRRALLNCGHAAYLFEHFLEDFDGDLSIYRWRLHAATATFIGLSRAEVESSPEVAFRVRRIGGVRSGNSGAGAVDYPHRGRFCRGTFRVLHDDRIGNLELPAGRYWIVLLDSKGPHPRSLTCGRASALFTRFLDSVSGRLPPPWQLDPEPAKFRRAEKGPNCPTESCFTGAGFRVKPVR